MGFAAFYGLFFHHHLECGLRSFQSWIDLILVMQKVPIQLKVKLILVASVFLTIRRSSSFEPRNKTCSKSNGVSLTISTLDTVTSVFPTILSSNQAGFLVVKYFRAGKIIITWQVSFQQWDLTDRNYCLTSIMHPTKGYDR